MSAIDLRWLALGIGAVSTLLAFAGTRGALGLALRRDLLDHPNERSSHVIPTPSGGGTGIVFAVCLALPLGAFLADRLELLLVLVPVLAMAGIGLVDDARELSPRVKMLLLVLAASCALPLGWVDRVSLPFLGEVGLNVLAIPLTLFWTTCFPNAFNFMDGINGIAGITAAVTGAAYAVAGVWAGDAAVAVLGAVTAGAAVGFLPWNFPGARIFMGDAGSLPLGFLLALTAVLANLPVEEPAARAVQFPASILMLGPFVFDVTYTLVRRKAEGKRLGEAHREHLYQRLSRTWGSHARVSLLYGGLSATMAIPALVYGPLPGVGRLVSLLLPLAAMLGFARWVMDLERKRSRRPAERV